MADVAADTPVIDLSVVREDPAGLPAEWDLPDAEWDLPDPDQVDQAGDEVAGSGRYRGRRRRTRRLRQSRHTGRIGRRAAHWGTAAVVAVVGLVLVGSGVLASYLSDPVALPAPPASPTPAPVAQSEGPTGADSRFGAAPTPELSPAGSPSPGAPAPGTPPGPPPPPGPPAAGSPPGPPPAATGEPADPAQPAPPPQPAPPQPQPAPPPPPAPSPACQVGVTIVNTGPGGYQVAYTITNTSGSRWTGWTLTFPAPDDVQHGHGWSGNWSQQGGQITVSNVPSNGTVDDGASVTVGHVASRPSGPPRTPSGFAVNGASCAAG